MMLVALGIMLDSHASTWAKEVTTDHAKGKATDALKSATDRVQAWSENRACQDPSSWGCHHAQDLGEKTNVSWSIISMGVSALFLVKMMVLISKLF